MSKHKKSWGDGHETHIQTDQSAPTAAPTQNSQVEGKLWLAVSHAGGGLVKLEELRFVDGKPVVKLLHDADKRSITMALMPEAAFREIMQ